MLQKNIRNTHAAYMQQTFAVVRTRSSITTDLPSCLASCDHRDRSCCFDSFEIWFFKYTYCRHLCTRNSLATWQHKPSAESLPINPSPFYSIPIPSDDNVPLALVRRRAEPSTKPCLPCCQPSCYSHQRQCVAWTRPHWRGVPFPLEAAGILRHVWW